MYAYRHTQNTPMRTLTHTHTHNFQIQTCLSHFITMVLVETHFLHSRRFSCVWAAIARFKCAPPTRPVSPPGPNWRRVSSLTWGWTSTAAIRDDSSLIVIIGTRKGRQCCAMMDEGRPFCYFFLAENIIYTDESNSARTWSYCWQLALFKAYKSLHVLGIPASDCIIKEYKGWSLPCAGDVRYDFYHTISTPKIWLCRHCLWQIHIAASRAQTVSGLVALALPSRKKVC